MRHICSGTAWFVFACDCAAKPKVPHTHTRTRTRTRTRTDLCLQKISQPHTGPLLLPLPKSPARFDASCVSGVSGDIAVSGVSGISGVSGVSGVKDFARTSTRKSNWVLFSPWWQLRASQQPLVG
jgi:hypothetical protein